MPEAHMPRMLLIGIDGADLLIAEELMDRGQLPNLSALVGRGAWGPMRSTVPPITPPAWTTMMTGKNPGKHGVFEFLPMDQQDASLPVASRRRATTVWRALSDRGYRVGTLNLPTTYPPEELSAFQVSGFDAPSFGPSAVSPPAAFEALERVAAGRSWSCRPPGDAAEGMRVFRDHAALVVEATRAMLRACPCDVCMVNFQIVDWAQHMHLADEMQPGDVGGLDADGVVAGTYRLVDEHIGLLLAEWTDDSTHVMIVSDHGFTLVDRVVNIEKLLLDSGLMAYKSATGRDGRRPTAGRSRARLALRLWGTLKRLAPWCVPLLAPLAHRLRAPLAAYQADCVIDWSRTRAVPWGLYGGIRLNLRGRDPEGIVPPAEVPVLEARIRRLLFSVTDPVTGGPVYCDVPGGAALYSGPFVSHGPDLVALPREERYLSVCGRMLSDTALPLIDAQPQVAVALERGRDFHACRGVFCAAGPEIEPGTRLPESGLEDFAPTILHLLREEIPIDMDGQPIVAALLRDSLAERPAKLGIPWPEADADEAVYTDGEQRQIEEALEALGYL